MNIGSETDKYANIISAANNYTVGLQKDGTVLSTTFSIDTIQDIPINQVKDWIDIIAVSAGSFHTVGLKKDGTVISTASINEYDYGQTNVSVWSDIVAVSAGVAHTVGLRRDGTVVSTLIIKDEANIRQTDVSNWKLF